jgi:hypothetical protein
LLLQDQLGRTWEAATRANLPKPSQLCRRRASELAFHQKVMVRKLPGPHSHRGGHWFDPSIAHPAQRPVPIIGPIRPFRGGGTLSGSRRSWTPRIRSATRTTPGSRSPPPGRPVEISIRGGTVSYSPDAPPAVRHIDLDLGPGRRVALVGATGAGKSTIAAVLFRFVDLSSGTALLNGRDLAGYDPDDVRAVISGCAQDPHIFDATIRDNLRLARPLASHAELLRSGGAYHRLWQAGHPADMHGLGTEDDPARPPETMTESPCPGSG